MQVYAVARGDAVSNMQRLNFIRLTPPRTRCVSDAISVSLPILHSRALLEICTRHFRINAAPLLQPSASFNAGVS